MKKVIGVLLVCLLVLSAFFLGKNVGSAEKVAEDGLSERNLRLSATTDRNEPNSPFQATLPSGYTLTMCPLDDGEAMITDSGDAQIGGLILTDLTAKDLTDSESFPLMHYLNRTLWNCQWISWNGDQDGHPTFRVSQSTAEDGTRDVFDRVLFERNSKVYDLWFVSDVADTATQTAFITAIVGD